MYQIARQFRTGRTEYCLLLCTPKRVTVVIYHIPRPVPCASSLAMIQPIEGWIRVLPAHFLSLLMLQASI